MIEIWNYFKQNGFTDEGAAAMLGNLYIESKLNPKNLQDSFNKSLNMSDEEYTKQVDNNIYKNFIYDKAGYGLAQWTHESRKQNFYKYIKSKNKSIGDLNAQLEFLLKELKKEYNKVYNKLKTSSNISELSDCVMLDYERPADKSESAKQKRRKSSENFYNQYTGGKNTMKYSKTNPPLACIMDNSTCYKGTSTMSVKGILWHSTGVNNPDLKRYVQPSEHDPNYHPLMAKLGKNAYGNDWNHETVQAGVNAWIGKLADGTIASIQTLPWNYKPWGCASGSRGSCNNGWIQFEICEDNLNSLDYFNKVYQEACELTAYLCTLYGLNPASSISFGGVNVPSILCHQDSYQLKLGSNHSDIYHWFNKYSKDMDDVRNDVAKIMGNVIISAGTATPIAPTVQVSCLGKGDVGDQVKALQENLIKLGFNCGLAGADGDFGKATEAAVIKFQKKYKLEVDGLVGPETQNKIKELIKENGETQSIVKTNIYRVRKTWADSKSQVGAYGILKNAQVACDKAGSGYSVFDGSGAVVYSAMTNRTEVKPSKTYNDVMIGHSSKDENNNYRGGAAGDQTGQEVCVRTWYRGNWNVVMRPTDPIIAEKIAATMEAACANNNIGYDQNERNTLYAEAKKVNLDISKITTPCECDCSSLVSICCIIAGLPESAFYSGGNMMTTYTLKKACLSTGKFEALETNKYYAQKDYLKRGDILLYENGHTAIVLADGQSANAETKNNNPFLVRITANSLNVRTGPDDNYLVSTTVKKGEVFTIIDMEGEWGKLKSGAGWINLNYTSKL